MGISHVCQEKKGKNREYEEKFKVGQGNNSVYNMNSSTSYNPEPGHNQPVRRNQGGGSRNRTITVHDEEIASAKINICIDKIKSHIRGLREKESQVDSKLKELIKAKRKEQAYSCLKKKKNIKMYIKDSENKIGVMERQLLEMEHAKQDSQFTKALQNSNRVIENFNEDIKMEEIALAKELQEESKIRREEIEELLDDNEDDELKKELDLMEAQMLESGLKEGSAEQGNKNPIEKQASPSDVKVPTYV